MKIELSFVSYTRFSPLRYKVYSKSIVEVLNSGNTEMVLINRSLEPRQQNYANVPEDEVQDELQEPLQCEKEYQLASEVIAKLYRSYSL